MKKVLLVATVQSHICQFHKPLIDLLHEYGYIVHVAAKDNLAEKNGLTLDFADKVFDIPFERSPFSLKNIKAKKILKKVIDENGYDVVHTNTPVGGVIARLSARKARSNGTKVYYTVHGFHFYKGASKKNWALYFPIEKYLERFTDKIITVTKEDYNFAKAKFNCKIEYIHGVGADANKYAPPTEEEKSTLRQEQNFSNDETIFLCIGELNKNKNQSTLIKAFANVVKQYPNAKLLLAGNGPTENVLKAKIKEYNLEDKIILLGYRTDLEKFIKLSDIIVSASFREGMPMNIIEGMISSKPVIVSKNRGHKELIKDNENGYIVNATDVDAFSKKMFELLLDKEKQIAFGKFGASMVTPWYADNVKQELKEIYNLN